METEQLGKMAGEVDALIKIIEGRRWGENRFNRAVRMLLSVVEAVN